MNFIGQKIMNYRITEKIGEGGMGTVYLAVHELLKTKAAIKVLHAALGTDQQLRARFLKEASTLSSLNHPNIVRVLDFTENVNGLFIIMEYVSGLALDDMIKTKTGPIPENRAYQIFEKILDGFEYAHNRKPAIIHRDIKPSNIIITEDDDPKIIDFGIVKIMDTSTNANHTVTGTKMGTPVFMSPEQILGQDLDNRSDIYSLGITLFTMVTGRSPFQNTLSEFEIQEKIIRQALPRATDIYPGVSNKTQSIIDKATAKHRDDRFESCSEFKLALKEIEKSQNLVLVRSIQDTALGNPPKRPAWKKIMASVCLMIIIVASVLAYLFWNKPIELEKTVSEHKLGDKTYRIIHYGKRQVMAHLISLHDNEKTGVEAFKSLKDIPQFDLFEVSQSGDRLLEYMNNMNSYRFDPNRIFSQAGILNTVAKSNLKYPGNIIPEITVFADTILNLLHMNNSSHYIIALHNNTDNDRSVNYYSSSTDASEVFTNPNADPDDFYLVTLKNDFDFFKSRNFNVVLQNENAIDDGSLSIFCGRKGIPYINIEAQYGHKENQMLMIDKAYSLITNK